MEKKEHPWCILKAISVLIVFQIIREKNRIGYFPTHHQHIQSFSLFLICSLELFNQSIFFISCTKENSPSILSAFCAIGVQSMPVFCPVVLVPFPDHDPIFFFFCYICKTSFCSLLYNFIGLLKPGMDVNYIKYFF